VLEEMQRQRTDQAPKALVFPSPHRGPYEQSSCSKFIYDTLKCEELVRKPDGSWSPITLHGFRSTRTDWCHAKGFAPRLIDLQLTTWLVAKLLKPTAAIR
jgi:hypothetical protein